MLFIAVNAGKIIDINKYLTDLWGYPKEYFQEHRIWDKEFFKAIVPDENKSLELQQWEFIHYEKFLLKKPM